MGLATLLEEDDKIEESLAAYRQAEEFMQRLGDRPTMVGARLNRIQGLLDLGRWDEAEAIHTQYVVAEIPEMGLDWDLSEVVVGSIWFW